MNKKGFTLIEILVVCFIIALLASIVLVSVNRARITARDAKRRADLASIKTAVEMYYDLNGTYLIKNKNVAAPNNFCGYSSSGPNSLGFFSENDGAAAANYKYGIGFCLQSWDFLNPAPVDPIHNGPANNWAHGSYEYVYWTDSANHPNKYSIYARLENPTDSNGDGWDDSSSSGDNAIIAADLLMNYRVGNGL